ncbi:hypothetical protein [Enterococcus pallens]|uniref:Uncharacterized protein n=1 Tax=Enterococcus pallens ATCC BAA-351 TaxID=1158607 RepID=R2SPM2_9ENTE|nr:hypothetical protein [Enterococcus pallens]EOH90104.1 hypothetical protein UAU_03933 [Enterococcus pallens ATCC BAA-351]EOU15290.1 hypothetical protein I588_04222 [Enterococcus pallens ATCC BAA-351]OJG77936.1 hypothetical protein RV10_GL002162 [Enterococcus pallens]
MDHPDESRPKIEKVGKTVTFSTGRRKYYDEQKEPHHTQNK